MPLLVSREPPAAQAPPPAGSPPARRARRLGPLPAATGGVIESIKVEGNQRIEDGTIRSYMLVQPGDPFDPTGSTAA